jgi:hypothetical protein
MKNLLLMTLVALAMTSCKDNESSQNQTPGSGEIIGNIESPAQRNFTTSEIAIGRRICGALRFKREKMETLTNLQEQFRLRGEIKNCNSPFPSIGEFSVAISNSNSAQLEYEALSTRANYFKDVVTDRSGVVGTMCDSLSASDTVSNQALSGSSYLRVNFLIANGFDTIQISKFTRDANGSYPLISTEGISIFTQSNQVDPKFFGVEKERIRNLKCAQRAIDTSYTKQTWVSSLTAY